MYYEGEGVERDHALAFSWYKRAAEEQDYAEAKCNLAWMYRLGVGVAQPDEAKAASWFERAANAGFAEAQFQFGNVLLTGRGRAVLKADPARGLTYIQQAAGNGYALAQLQLGYVHYEEQNYVRAVRQWSAVWQRRRGGTKRGRRRGKEAGGGGGGWLGFSCINLPPHAVLPMYESPYLQKPSGTKTAGIPATAMTPCIRVYECIYKEGSSE